MVFGGCSELHNAIFIPQNRTVSGPLFNPWKMHKLRPLRRAAAPPLSSFDFWFSVFSLFIQFLASLLLYHHPPALPPHLVPPVCSLYSPVMGDTALRLGDTADVLWRRCKVAKLNGADKEHPAAAHEYGSDSLRAHPPIWDLRYSVHLKAVGHPGVCGTRYLMELWRSEEVELLMWREPLCTTVLIIINKIKGPFLTLSFQPANRSHFLSPVNLIFSSSCPLLHFLSSLRSLCMKFYLWSSLSSSRVECCSDSQPHIC